jgi:hypothetical protein
MRHCVPVAFGVGIGNHETDVMTNHDYCLLDFEMLMQQQVDVVGQGAFIVASDWSRSVASTSIVRRRRRVILVVLAVMATAELFLAAQAKPAQLQAPPPSAPVNAPTNPTATGAAFTFAKPGLK